MISGARRAADLREVMDDPQADLVLLERTYLQFGLVNRVLAGWRSLYRHEIRPRLQPGRSTSLLDIGCGGGDVARRLARWARADGLRLQVTGIDPDPRAHAWARRRPVEPGVGFELADSAELVASGRRFDVVVSNHLLHHLREAELSSLLADSERLAGSLVLHNDLERRTAAWLGWSVLSLPLARRSLVRRDGLTSLRRSFTAAELAAVLPPGWTVQRQAPYRLVLRFPSAQEAPGAG